MVLAILALFPSHVNFRIRIGTFFLSFFYPEKDFPLGIHMPAATAAMTVQFHTWGWPQGRTKREKERKVEILLTLSSLQGFYSFLDVINI